MATTGRQALTAAKIEARLQSPSVTTGRPLPQSGAPRQAILRCTSNFPKGAGLPLERITCSGFKESPLDVVHNSPLQTSWPRQRNA
jgi:hypothetical protein